MKWTNWSHKHEFKSSIFTPAYRFAIISCNLKNQMELTIEVGSTYHKILNNAL